MTVCVHLPTSAAINLAEAPISLIPIIVGECVHPPDVRENNLEEAPRKVMDKHSEYFTCIQPADIGLNNLDKAPKQGNHSLDHKESVVDVAACSRIFRCLLFLLFPLCIYVFICYILLQEKTEKKRSSINKVCL